MVLRCDKNPIAATELIQVLTFDGKVTEKKHRQVGDCQIEVRALVVKIRGPYDIPEVHVLHIDGLIVQIG